MADSINIKKIRTIILYFVDKVDRLYVTKLMKLFYYIDFISYAERKSSITNDIYYKLPYGPVPSFIKNEIDNLEEPVVEGWVKSQFSDIIYLKEAKDKYGKIIEDRDKKYDLRMLSSYETDLINKVIDKLGNRKASVLTKKTHKEAPYKHTSENSVISYELADELGGRKVLDD